MVSMENIVHILEEIKLELKRIRISTDSQLDILLKMQDNIGQDASGIDKNSENSYLEIIKDEREKYGKIDGSDTATRP